MTAHAPTETFYEACVTAGIPTDSHESDLYVPLTDATYALVRRFSKRVTPFRHATLGTWWIDVPFAFDPWWSKRADRSTRATPSGLED